MDATANEVEGISIEGFPTIKFYRGKENGKMINYQGDRTEEGFIKFLKENTSFDWPKDDL